MVKKYFIFFLPLFTITPLFAQTDVMMTEAPPNKDMQMRIELSHDTVTFGQEFYISLIFENLSDSMVLFYPRGGLFIEHNFCEDVFFREWPIVYILNLFQDFDKSRMIKSGGSTKDIYTVITTDFFSKGENVLYVSYRFGWQNGKRRKKKKESTEVNVYRRLVSPNFNIYVK